MLENAQNTAVSNLIASGETQKQKENTQKKQKNKTHANPVEFAFCATIIAVLFGMMATVYSHATDTSITIHTSVITKDIHHNNKGNDYYTLTTKNNPNLILTVSKDVGDALTLNQKDTITYSKKFNNVITLKADSSSSP